jgi:hypothetical protein
MLGWASRCRARPRPLLAPLPAAWAFGAVVMVTDYGSCAVLRRRPDRTLAPAQTPPPNPAGFGGGHHISIGMPTAAPTLAAAMAFPRPCMDPTNGGPLRDEMDFPGLWLSFAGRVDRLPAQCQSPGLIAYPCSAQPGRRRRIAACGSRSRRGHRRCLFGKMRPGVAVS